MFDSGISPDRMTRLMYGQNAIQLGANLIVQKMDDGKVIFNGQSAIPNQKAHPLTFGSRQTHQLILGDMVFRPHLVLGSNHLRGSGWGNIATDGFQIDQWIESESLDLILDMGVKQQPRVAR